jgi:hypothetical protein
MGLYYHHGIYVGRLQVIHYSGLSSSLIDKGPIDRTTLEKFVGESTIEIVPYTSPLPKDEIIDNAKNFKQKLGDPRYNVFWSNCEHFATWCMTGEWKSKQIQAAVLGGLAGLLYRNLIDW